MTSGMVTVKLFNETLPCTPPECPPVNKRHHLIRAWFLQFNIDFLLTDQINKTIINEVYCVYPSFS